MKQKFFQYYFYFMTIFTGLAVLLFPLFTQPENLLVALAQYPILTISVIFLLLLWALTLLISSFLLLFNEKSRELVFLSLTSASVFDELEEKATSDAIKRTFVFNLAVLSFLFSISGISYTYELDSLGEKHFNVSYGLISKRHGKVSAKKIMETLVIIDPELKENLKKHNVKLEHSEESEETRAYLVPNSFFSPYGLLCFILLQFLSFKFFLFLNLRKLQ